MALTALGMNTPMLDVPRSWEPATVTTLQTAQLDAAGERCGWAFQVDADTSIIDEFAFEVSAVATGASPAGSVRLYTVDTSNSTPSRPLTGVGTSVNFNLTTGVPGTVKVTGLNYTPTAGEILMALVENTSGDFTVIRNTGSTTERPLPYSYTLLGGSHSIGAAGVGFPVAVGGASSAWRRIPSFDGPHAAVFTQVLFDQNDNPDEYGGRLIAPVAGRLVGVRMQLGITANTSLVLSAYSGVSSPSLLSGMQRTFDTDQLGFANTGTSWRTLMFRASADLAAGDTVAIVVRPSSTIDISIQERVYSAADYALGGYPLAWRRVSRDGGSGDFTVDTARIPMMFPIFSHFDDGAGGGGTTRAFMLGGA